MRKQACICAAIMVMSASGYAGTAFQDDWAGSSGVLGPIIEWGTDYFAESGTDPATSPGYLTLSGETSKNIVSDSFTDAFSVSSGDIDGDGIQDVLGGSVSDASLRWWRNADGAGTAWEENIISVIPGIRGATLADVDGDEDLDAIAGAGNMVVWFRNEDGSGGSWTTHYIKDSSSIIYYVDCDNINGDGFSDVVAAEHYSNQVWWLENQNGMGTSWTMTMVDDASGGPYCLLIRDLDGDGDGDIVGSLFFDMQICWWENTDGSGTSWTRYQIGGTVMDPRYIDTCDMDGDGDTDVIGTGYDEVFWCENTDGSATAWSTHIIDGSFLGAHDVEGSDLDGDGDLDVLTVSFNTEEILWWENLDGIGTSWSQHMLDPSFEDGCAVCTADLDANGTPDPIGAAYVDDEIAWWNIPAEAGGYLESSILDTQEQPDWDMLLISAEMPPGTSVGCQLRCSDDHTQMGPWSDTLVSPTSLEGVLEEGKRYLQYRLLLCTEDPAFTPVVDQITVTWDPLGIPGSLEEQITMYPLANPSRGNAVLSIGLPHAMEAELSLFDLSGRLVREVRDVFQAGCSQVAFDDIPTGVYCCRLEAGCETVHDRLVVLD